MIDTIKQIKESATREAQKDATIYAQKWGMSAARDRAAELMEKADAMPTTYIDTYAKAYGSQLDTMEVGQ